MLGSRRGHGRTLLSARQYQAPDPAVPRTASANANRTERNRLMAFTSGATIPPKLMPLHTGNVPADEVSWPQRDEGTSPLDAGLVRAYARADDADAERRAGVARRQRRAGPPGRRSPISSWCRMRVVPTVERLMREHDPEVVGLSVMTFQRRTALRLVRSIRAIKPAVTVVAGGYDPSLAPEAYEAPVERRRLRRPRRRRADVPRPAARARRAAAMSPAFRDCPSARTSAGGGSAHTPARPVSRLEDGSRRRCRTAAPACWPATRSSAARSTSSKRRAAAPTTAASARSSRCAAATSTPSTSRRVLADIADARARGARAIFLVDDNITLNVARFEALCRAIVDAGLNDIHYIVQAMTSSIANHGATLAPLMRKAGFRYVFLGIENVLEEDLAFLRASAKNAQREGGRRTGNATIRAIEPLHARRALPSSAASSSAIPTTRAASIEANLAFARRYVDWPYIQHPTPYPGHADDRGLPPARPDRQRAGRGVRRHDRGRADGAPRGGRDRVPALARRAVDEGAAPAPRAAPLSAASSCATGRRCCAHTFRGSNVAIGARPRERARGVRPLQGAARGRTRVHPGRLRFIRGAKPLGY